MQYDQHDLKSQSVYIYVYIYLRAVISLDEELRHIALKRILLRSKCGHPLPQCSTDSLRSCFTSKTSVMNFPPKLKLLSPSSSGYLKATSFWCSFSYFSSVIEQNWESKQQGFFKIPNTILCWMLVFYHLTLRNTLTQRVNKAIKNRKDSANIFIFQDFIHTSFILIKSCTKTNSLREEYELWLFPFTFVSGVTFSKCKIIYLKV